MIPKVSFCDDLDEPNLGIVMDKAWLDEVRQELIPWLLERGVAMVGDEYNGYMFLMDESTKVEFLVRWA